MQRRELLVLAHQQHAAANAQDALELDRQRLVRGPQHPDHERARDAGRRDQPRGREVVVGAVAERERDPGHEDERRGDLPEPGAALARGVEACLPEHEQGDRDQERQPLGRSRLPEQAPEDLVPEDQAPEDERGVEPEGEAGRVERRKRGDGEHATHEGAKGAARQDVRRRRADVAGAELGWLGRLCRHGRELTPAAGRKPPPRRRRPTSRRSAPRRLGGATRPRTHARIAGSAVARASSAAANAPASPAGKRRSRGRPPRNSSSARLLATTAAPHAAASQSTLSNVSDVCGCVVLTRASTLRRSAGTSARATGPPSSTRPWRIGVRRTVSSSSARCSPIDVRQLGPMHLEPGVEPVLEREAQSLRAACRSP